MLRSLRLFVYPSAVFVNCIPTPRIVTCNLSPFSTVVFGLTVTVLSNSLNAVVMSMGLTSNTGTVTSFVVISAYVNTTVTVFLPSTSLILPLSLIAFPVGTGSPAGITSLSNILLFSDAGTDPCAFLSFAALNETSGVFNVITEPFAVPLASVLSTSSVVIAFVFTEVLSLTSASLILIVPVVESIVNGAPASSSQPVAFLVAV